MHAREEHLRGEKFIQLTVLLLFSSLYCSKNPHYSCSLCTVIRHSQQFWRPVHISFCFSLSSSLLRPWKLLVYSSQKNRGLEQHFYGTLNQDLHRKRKIAFPYFLFWSIKQWQVCFLSTAYYPSCSYFIAEPLQYLPNNSYSTVTYGCIYTGSSPLDEKAHCLSFPREHGFDTTISEI